MDKKRLCQLLGLAATASDGEIEQALKAFGEQSKAYGAVLEKAGLKDGASIDDVVAALSVDKGLKPLADDEQPLATDLVEALGLKDGATIEEVVTQAQTLSLAAAGAKEMAKKVQDDTKRIDALEAKDVVAEAKKSGLVAAAGMEKFRAMAAKNPAQAKQVLDNLGAYGVALPVDPGGDGGGDGGADPPKSGAKFSAGAIELAEKRGRDEKFLEDNIPNREEV